MIHSVVYLIILLILSCQRMSGQSFWTQGHKRDRVSYSNEDSVAEESEFQASDHETKLEVWREDVLMTIPRIIRF